jgi:hypothetical protein
VAVPKQDKIPEAQRAIAVKNPDPAGVFEGRPEWHFICFIPDMKGKTLYYCPRDEDMLLFEEVYDERLDFAYQPLREIPCVCPKCGFILFKKDCVVIEELFAHPGAGSAPGETR